MAPNIPSIHHSLGLIYAELGEWDSSIVYFHNAVERSPGNFKSVYALAKAYSKQGNMENAEKYYLQALEIEPKSSHALIEIANLYYDQEKWKQSLEHLLIADSLNPDEPSTLFLIGLTAQKSGNIDLVFDSITKLRGLSKYKEARRLEYALMSESPDNPANSP